MKTKVNGHTRKVGIGTKVIGTADAFIYPDVSHITLTIKGKKYIAISNGNYKIHGFKVFERYWGD